MQIYNQTNLAQTFGTPLYVYRIEEVRRAVNRLRVALPAPHRLYYSVKANPNPGVVRELVGLGLHSEVSSGGELAVTLAAGQPPDRVLYTGPGKTTAEVSDAIRRGIRLFSVESEVDYRRIGAEAAKAGAVVEYLIRINGGGMGSGTGAGLRMTGRPSQFGIDLDALWSMPEVLAGSPVARPVGLHFYSVTNVTEEDALADEFAANIRLAAYVIDRAGLPAVLVDLGGGFAAPFAQPGAAPRYKKLRPMLERLLDTHIAGWRGEQPTIMFEAGRYLVGGCGTLLSRVLDIKRSQGRVYVVLDAGINVLGGVSATGRLRPPRVQPCDTARPSGPPVRDPRTTEPVTLVGPLCTPIDVLSRTTDLINPQVDDVIAIPNVGAYGLTASVLGFLSRQPPLEVLLGADHDMPAVTTLTLQRVETTGERRG